MTWLEIVVLAIVQGMTEFLPVSSSGHLILAPALLGWSDQGLAFDVAVHVGTLAAVVVYFRQDLSAMTSAFFRRSTAGRGDTQSGDARLAWCVIVGTVPVGLAGIAFHDFIEASLRSPAIIATTTAVFGVLLWLAAKLGKGNRTIQQLSLAAALIIGVAQALALVPGTSRSGITMTAAFALGFSATAAARFSFLLSIPVITTAGGYEALKLATGGNSVDWLALVMGSLISGTVAYLTIKFFMRFVAKIGMAPFMLYRLALAALIVIALV
ncbi:MAG: undecaprenyl-diphosphate phosphatase [Pseudomonadota bacterium]